MREIKPEDIREGDLIRWESGDEPDRANEYRAKGPVIKVPGRHYLLDRPHVAVDLPDEPTLGWVEGIDLRRQFGAWVTSGTQETLYAMRQSDWATSEVTSFVEAVAVPKAALDELREDLVVERLSQRRLGPNTKAAQRFLAAIDAANGDPR